MVERVLEINVSKENFINDVYPLRKPCVIHGLDIGPAQTLWTADYLADKCGAREVKVHVCPYQCMDFINKNFAYRTLSFNEFVVRANQPTQSNYFLSPNEKYYLRALGSDPRKDIASIDVQFPEIAADIVLPMMFGKENFFSSVLRIGSPNIRLWTHYDVMDNFLVQVTGKKKVVLFSPEDALNLYMIGDKSRVLDIDNPDISQYPLFPNATRYECELYPGDVLFIPSLWFHNVVSIDFSVAVNIFWKHLSPKFYDQKDVYGNKDPPQVQRAMQILDGALKVLDEAELPPDYKDFYGRCMVNKIQNRLFKSS